VIVGLGGMGGFMQVLVFRERYIRKTGCSAATTTLRGMGFRQGGWDDAATSFADVLKQVKSLFYEVILFNIDRLVTHLAS